MKKVVIIAEVGPNHNGNLKTAYKLVNLAKKCGADFVKFQTSIPELHISKFAIRAKYQLTNKKKKQTQLPMAKRFQLSYEDFRKLKKHCNKKKIGFLSTPFDLKSIDFLKSLKPKYFKIPSGEITNLPYLLKVAKLKKKIILSTGMSNMEEVVKAVKILKSNGTRKNDITVMQCNTEYPTPFKDANLKAMISIKKKLKVNVGYSDHTEGIEAALAAVALGAKIIEKHFTLSKNLSGPDHKASITESELKSLVDGVKKISVALGDGIKKVSFGEKKNIVVSRNSLVAANFIRKGDKFSKFNLAVKRPGNGISPMKIFKIIGRVAKRNFIKDELISI